jgi:hypothetical protein
MGSRGQPAIELLDRKKLKLKNNIEENFEKQVAKIAGQY